MSARDDILERIRRANGTPADGEDIRAEALRLIADTAPFQPQFAGQTLLQRFIEKATSERVTATVEMVPDMAALPAAVSGYLDGQGLARRITLQPRAALTSLNWQDIDTAPTVDADGAVALTCADFGIAETGSVVFRSGSDAPVLLNFLPLHHLVVLRADTLLAHLEDAFLAAGPTAAEQPRNLCIVTGTSGTADIEARNVRGAHGPRFMHILIVDEPGA